MRTSRGIERPAGGPGDRAGAETIAALGRAKNDILVRWIRHDGVQASAGSVCYVRAAVFEDALSGVQAGRAGGYGFVVGVDRVGQSHALRAAGAEVLAADLAELLDRA